MTRSVTLAVASALLIGSTCGQRAAATAASYCAELKEIASLADGRFTPIRGPQREGSFSETTAPLPGWGDCSLYGATTYTCDSQTVHSADDAERLQAKVADEILSCFAGTWLQVLDRSSATYAVLHPARGAASITLSVDQTDEKQFVVRLALFIRRNQ
jgi:hypothetical protein